MTDTTTPSDATPVAPAPFYTGVKLPVFANAGKTEITCQVLFTSQGVYVPFIAMPNDPESHGGEIFANCLKGLYGPVGAFVAPTPTPQAQYAAALAQGIAVTSASTPALNGTYAVDGDAQVNISTEAQFVSTFAEFTNGLQLFDWPDAAGAAHTFPTTALFMAFAKAAALYVSACKQTMAMLAAGNSAAWPSNAVSIT